MTTELLKQARDALAKSEPTGIYKYSMTAAKRHENLIKEIDAALAQPADEDAWFKKARELLKVFTRTMLDDYSECASAVKAENALLVHLRTRPQQAGFVSVPVEPFVVRHYIADERPSIKGNGFDGLYIGEDREEAEQFVKFINAAMIEAAKGDGK